MNAYRHTVVVLPLQHVFGSPDLSLLCLSRIDLQMYTVVRLLAVQAVNITLDSRENFNQRTTHILAYAIALVNELNFLQLF